MRRILLASACLSFLSAAPALAQAATPAQAPAALAQAVPAAIAALAPIPQGRLTDAARPTAYRLDLTIDPAAARFSGHVEIDAVLARPARFIDLHGRDLAMHRATATVAGRSFAGTFTQIDPTGVARLTFAETVPAGPVMLAFDYDAPFEDNDLGLFHVKVQDQWYVWSQFESIDARAAFPGFDEPGFKVPFAITLRTPPGLIAVSNAPEASRTREGARDVHRFAPTAPLPSYLVAMMVGPFATLGGAVAPTAQRKTSLPLRIVTTQPNAARLAYALDGLAGYCDASGALFRRGVPVPQARPDNLADPVRRDGKRRGRPLRGPAAGARQDR